MAQLFGAATKLDALKWRCIGPPRGGRVVAVAGDPEDRGVFYFGAIQCDRADLAEHRHAFD